MANDFFPPRPETTLFVISSRTLARNLAWRVKDFSLSLEMTANRDSK